MRLSSKFYWMALWGRCKFKAIFSIFVSLIWIAGLIYYMIGQLISVHKTQHTLDRRKNTTSTDSELSSILSHLGFVSKPAVFQPSQYRNQALPVFALFVEHNQVDDFYNFWGSFKQYYPKKKLIVYDLGIPARDLSVIERSCQCEIRKVNWDLYPAHIQNNYIKAYRPIVIQETLNEFGMVFWCDPDMRFTSSNLQPHLSQAQKHGLVSWTLSPFPTSAQTYYHMFRYFNTNHSCYYFHRFAHPNLALFVNTMKIHKHLMLKWVSCALNIDCIAPTGSQPGGCNFQHKPKYMYAGCHHYDVSAFNIILGQLFDMDTPYIGSDDLFYIEKKR